MGSAVGRAVSAMDHLRGIRRGTTLRNGSVTPIDGNKFVQRECKKLEKKLPGKMVEMKLGSFLFWCLGVIRRYNDRLIWRVIYCVFVYTWILYIQMHQLYAWHCFCWLVLLRVLTQASSLMWYDILFWRMQGRNHFCPSTWALYEDKQRIFHKGARIL